MNQLLFALSGEGFRDLYCRCLFVSICLRIDSRYPFFKRTSEINAGWTNIVTKYFPVTNCREEG